eukprot:SAG31_NODE_12673_length_925_cov_1.406780_2_plen_83_part_01
MIWYRFGASFGHGACIAQQNEIDFTEADTNVVRGMIYRELAKRTGDMQISNLIGDKPNSHFATPALVTQLDEIASTASTAVAA